MASLYKEGMTLHKALIHNPLLKLSQFAFSPTLTNLNIRGASTYPCWTSLTFCRLFSLLLVHGVRSLYQQFTICNCLTPSLPLNFSVFFSSSHTSLSLSLLLSPCFSWYLSLFFYSLFFSSQTYTLLNSVSFLSLCISAYVWVIWRGSGTLLSVLIDVKRNPLNSYAMASNISTIRSLNTSELRCCQKSPQFYIPLHLTPSM